MATPTIIVCMNGKTIELELDEDILEKDKWGEYLDDEGKGQRLCCAINDALKELENH